MPHWLQDPYEPRASHYRLPATLIAPAAGPFVAGVIAAIAETLSPTVGVSFGRIVHAYLVVGIGYSFVLSIGFGWPYLAVYNRWLRLPRFAFVFGATWIGVVFGLATAGPRAALLFALCAAVNAAVYAAITHDA